jgi:hypothetical protein
MPVTVQDLLCMDATSIPTAPTKTIQIQRLNAGQRVANPTLACFHFGFSLLILKIFGKP